MRLSEMNDNEAGAALLKAYRGACDNYDPDEHGAHPSHAVKNWVRIAATGGQNSEKGEDGRDFEGDESAEVDGSDNPPDFPGKPANPTLGKPTVDGRFMVATDGTPRFEVVGRDGKTTAILTGDAALEARSRASNPGAVRGMKNAIAGYDTRK